MKLRCLQLTILSSHRPEREVPNQRGRRQLGDLPACSDCLGRVVSPPHPKQSSAARVYRKNQTRRDLNRSLVRCRITYEGSPTLLMSILSSMIIFPDISSSLVLTFVPRLLSHTHSLTLSPWSPPCSYWLAAVRSPRIIPFCRLEVPHFLHLKALVHQSPQHHLGGPHWTHLNLARSCQCPSRAGGPWNCTQNSSAQLLHLIFFPLTLQLTIWQSYCFPHDTTLRRWPKRSCFDYINGLQFTFQKFITSK